MFEKIIFNVGKKETILHYFKATCLYAVPNRLGPTQRVVLSKMFVTDDGADCT